MKTVGIIGGIGPESTVAYYRGIVAGYRERKRDGSYPSILINSIDLQRVLDLTAAGELAELTRYLVSEIQRLADGGADFALLAANTPHIVFEDVARGSPILLISIVEATCRAAAALGLERVALFGTRFTMQGRFYPDVFQRSAVALTLPAPDDQVHIHDIYVNELLNGVFRPETRDRLLAIIERMKAGNGIDGVILGGTELPLLLTQPEHAGIALLDTTKLHVEEVLAELLR